MQASAQVLLNFRDSSKIPIEITNEIDSTLEILGKKIKLTPKRKDIIYDHVIRFYGQSDDDTKIKPIEIVGITVYEFLPFLTYQLLSAWLGIERSLFMKRRNKLVEQYPELFNFS